MQITTNGNGVQLGTAVRIATVIGTIIISFVWLQASVRQVEAQAQANAAQNEVDKQTKVRVDNHEKLLTEQRQTNSAMITNQTGIREALAQLQAQNQIILERLP